MYRALVDSDDLQQLVLRLYEECDCGSGETEANAAIG